MKMLRVRDLLAEAGKLSGNTLAAVQNGQVLSLNSEAASADGMTPLTLRDEEGRRVYERSLRFVLLLAVRRLYPGQRVMVDHSAGQGSYIRLPGMDIRPDVLLAIDEEMHRITAAALPFETEDMPVADAIRLFGADGQPDKVRLLSCREGDSVAVSRCGGMPCCFYGTLVPDTSAVSVFRLLPEAGGFVLMQPDTRHPDEPAPYDLRPKHMAVFSQSERWCEVLNASTAADLHDMVAKGNIRDFIRVSEALHEQALGQIARDIVQENRPVILIAGPSGSGKTTTANKLAIQLRVLGKRPVILSMDNYYRNRCDIPQEADGSVDLESIHALDLPLLQQQVQDLVDGRGAEVPVYSFRKSRREEQGILLKPEAGQPLIIEGIHGLNPLLTDGLPAEKVYRLFVSALTCVNLDDHNRIRTTDVRLMRRTVRDLLFRGFPAEDTLAMWDSVRRGEESWIFPHQERADGMMNTTLHYEILVLKKYIVETLQKVPAESPNALRAARLLELLKSFPVMPDEYMNEIPPLSLLREFIGGGTLDAH